MLWLVPGIPSVCIISGVPVMEAPHAKGSGVQQAVPITYITYTFMMEPVFRIRIQLGQWIRLRNPDPDSGRQK
jgi:hypothetical protein